MAHQEAFVHTSAELFPLAVRKIRIADLTESLRQGLADFWAMPSHLLIMAAIYPAVGILLGRAATGSDLLPLVFPMIMGFALIGPLAATGLYELSRRREMGSDLSWGNAFGVLRSPGIMGVATLGILLFMLFFLWLAVAQGLYQWAFADMPAPKSASVFLTQILTTPQGWALLIAGNGAGLLFAILALTISVVSFPLMIDRHVSALTAIATSTRVVLENPVPMMAWGLIIACSLVIGSIPVLLGLMFVVPVLGHATWHLYRKLVV